MIKYKDWPIWVRMTTSFSNKLLYSKRSSDVKRIAFIALIYFLFLLFGQQESNSNKIIGFLIITIFIFVSAYSVDWIEKNSSWEERFNNSSSNRDKLGGVFYISLALVGLWFFLKDLRFISDLF